MISRPSSNHRILLAFAAIAIPAAFACGGGGGADQDSASMTPVCTTPTDSIIAGALTRLIETRNPRPNRFLVPLGRDSVVPDGSRYPMQTEGRNMYLWPGDEKTQNEQIGNMRARGPAITVALFYLGMNDLGGGKATVDFSGRYVDLANNGKVISPTTVTFDCFATGARFRASDEPPAADAAPGDAPSPGGSGAPGGSGGS